MKPTVLPLQSQTFKEQPALVAMSTFVTFAFPTIFVLTAKMVTNVKMMEAANPNVWTTVTSVQFQMFVMTVLMATSPMEMTDVKKSSAQIIAPNVAIPIPALTAKKTTNSMTTTTAFSSVTS